MKMRSLFLLAIVLLIGNVAVNAEHEEKKKPLLMLGEIDLISIRSLPSNAPIITYQTDDALLIEINVPVGLIDIQISQGNDVVYNNSIDFRSPTQFMIYTGDYEPGSYLLEFCNTSCMYTEFSIE